MPTFKRTSSQSLGLSSTMSEEQRRTINLTYEHRWNVVLWALFGVTILLAIVFQSVVRCLSVAIHKANDRFLRELFDSTFRQLAIIALVIASILVVLRIDFVEYKLDQRIFHDIAQYYPSVEGTSHLETIFDQLLQVTMVFTVVYIIFVLYYTIVTRDTMAWLSNVDGADIHSVLQESAQKRIGLNRRNAKYLEYAALRYEFVDTVESNGVPGLDPSGYYFMEYLRACCLSRSVGVIRIPNLTLAATFLMATAFTFSPAARWKGWEQIVAVASAAGGSLALSVFIFIRIRMIEAQIRPSDTYQYVSHRCLAEMGNIEEDKKLIEKIGPSYKRAAAGSGWCCGPWQRLLYGTQFPSSHESLFWFWKRGPTVLTRLLELSYFLQLLVLSTLIHLTDKYTTVWWETYGSWPVYGVLAVSILHFLMLPSLLWRLVLVTSTGGLISDKILQDVWEDQRAATVRRSAQFIDQIKMDAMMWEIEVGGEGYWRRLAASASMVTAEAALQTKSIFAKLDQDNDGLLRLPQFQKWIVTQGVALLNSQQANIWFKTLDHDKDGGLDSAEFEVTVYVVKRLLGDPLEPSTIFKLLEGKYGVLPEPHVILDSRMLSAVLKGLSLNWSESQVKHFIDYASGRRTRDVSVVEFVDKLRLLETETLGALHNAVDQLKGRTGYDDAEFGSRLSGTGHALEAI